MTTSPIRFQSPCQEDWNAMTPEGRTRRCDRCVQAVHDVQDYTPEEVEALMARPGETPCLRAAIYPDGRVKTRPSPQDRVLTALVLAPALAMGLAGAAGAASSEGSIQGRLEARRPGDVTITAEGAQVSRQVKARDDGTFLIGALPQGTYRLIFRTRDGQKQWQAAKVEVAAGEAAWNYSIEPGFRPPEPIPVMTLGAPMPPVVAPPRPVAVPSPRQAPGGLVAPAGEGEPGAR